MSKPKNQYAKNKKKQNLLGSITATQETKGKPLASGLETLKDLAIGVIGGGVAGAIVNKYSLVTGAVVTGIGHFTKSRIATSFGIGMMASGVYRKAQTVSGVSQGGLAGAKERVMAFKENLTEKLFLDKILKKKAETTNGVGEVQYFLPNGNQAGELDLTALDRIEKQIAESATAYSQVSGMGELSGELNEPLDLGSRNY